MKLIIVLVALVACESSLIAAKEPAGPAFLGKLLKTNKSSCDSEVSFQNSTPVARKKNTNICVFITQAWQSLI